MRRLGVRFGRRVGARVGGGSSPPPTLEWPEQMAAIYPTMAWWDPGQGYTLNGSTVSDWEDRISGYVVSQASGAIQPTHNAVALNGHPGIGDAGATRWLQGASALAALIDDAAAYTVIFYGRVRSAATLACLFNAGTLASSDQNIETVSVSTAGVMRSARESAGAVINTGALTITALSSYTFTCAFSGSANRLWRDTSAEAGNPFANTKNVGTLDVITIGARWRLGAAALGWNNVWGDIVVVPAALTDPQIADGQSWMAARYA